MAGRGEATRLEVLSSPYSLRLLVEAAVMRGCACALKFAACDALSRPIAAHMLRWEGSRLVSHGGVGFCDGKDTIK